MQAFLILKRGENLLDCTVQGKSALLSFMAFEIISDKSGLSESHNFTILWNMHVNIDVGHLLQKYNSLHFIGLCAVFYAGLH